MKINLGSLGTIDVDPADVEEIDLDAEEYCYEGERLTEARAEEIARGPLVDMIGLRRMRRSPVVRA